MRTFFVFADGCGPGAPSCPKPQGHSFTPGIIVFGMFLLALCALYVAWRTRSLNRKKQQATDTASG